MLAAHLRACTLVLLLLVPAPALAAGQEAAPAAANRTLAIENATKGLELYRAERWQEAYERFREADRLYHAPSVVIYLARCQKKLGKLVEALALYEQILADPPAKYASAQFFEAYSDAQSEIEDVRTKRASMRSVAPPPAPPPSPPADAEQQKGSLLPGGIVLGLGAAGLAVGAITGGLSLSKASQLTPELCPNKHCPRSAQSIGDSVKTLGTISTATFIVGGAAAAAGAVLLVVRPGGGSKPAASGGASRAAPEVSAGVGIGWLDLRGSF
jgi:hypothetical protein